MSQFNELRPLVEAFFRQRGEESVAGEMVTELGLKKKQAKVRALVLTRPIGSTNDGATAAVNIVNLDDAKKQQHVKLKSAFAVERLVDISNEGNFDATLNFGASGMLSVSFESHIQREMFVAAVRRLQSSSGMRAGRGDGGGGVLANVRGVLTEAVGAEAEADAAARVRKLRQDKRRVFSTEEEQHLLKHMSTGGASFDDIRQFQETLLCRQKMEELKSLHLLATSEAAWKEAQQQVQDLVADVEEVEQRIDAYTTHLLSKKGVIQQVEHDNNTLQRRQLNLEQLYIMMADLRDQLRLAPSTLQILERLRTVPESELVNFFADGSTAVTLSVAMKHMEAVLHNPKLESDFPILAVTQRKSFFLERRRMITERSKSYILTTIDENEAAYLAERSRYSNDTQLVFRLHLELTHKLINISDIIRALGRIDQEGYQTALRKYRSSMQKIYALELERFFKGLRKQVKKVNSWKGPFLLGASESKNEALSMRMETAQAGETPPTYPRGSVGTPALTPRIMRYDDDNDPPPGPRGGVGGAAQRSEDGGTQLTIQFPTVADLSISGRILPTRIELYRDPNTLRRLDARAASTSVVSGIKVLGFNSSGGGGYVRPDLAFAIVLESVMMAILHEEALLGECFDLTQTASNGEKTKDDTADAKSGMNGSTTTSIGGSGAISPEERSQLLRESLLELFGGVDTVTLLQQLQGAGGAGPAAGSSRAHSRSSSIDGGALGMPPRAPASNGAGGLYYDSNGFPHRAPLGGGSVPGTPRAGMSPQHSRSASEIIGAEETAGGGEEDAVSKAAARRCFIVREMRELAKFFADKCDRIYCVPILCMIRAYRAASATDMLPTTSSFCQILLRELEAVMVSGRMRFVAEQTASIQHCRRRFLVKPTALLHCFSKLPTFFLRMEAVHNALAPSVCDRTEYASIAMSIVDQAFDALDTVTNMKNAEESTNESSMKLSQLLARKVNYALDGVQADMNSLKWVFIQQYRHHAFFCAFYATMPSDAYALELLQDHYATSKMKRDRYEELYLTRALLVRAFPVFGIFALSAEDLANIYSQEELRHHRALAPEAVEKVVAGLPKEMKSGIRSTAERMKKHFLRDVDLGGNEASFHKTLLQRTWQHFSMLLLQKFDFLSKMLAWPAYTSIKMAVTRREVSDMLAQF